MGGIKSSKLGEIWVRKWKTRKKNAKYFSILVDKMKSVPRKIACMSAQPLSHIAATPWTIAHQAPLSMGFSRQEYWSWLPFLPPGNLPDPGIEPDLVSLALAGRVFPTSATWEAQ